MYVSLPQLFIYINYISNQIVSWVTGHNENILSDTSTWMTSHEKPALKTLFEVSFKKRTKFKHLRKIQ